MGRPRIGTELKFNCSLSLPSDLTMDGVDFSATFTGENGKSLEIKKADMKRVDEKNYLALVDTSLVGKGRYICTFTVYIPDEDFADSLRTEIFDVLTNVVVV